MEQNYGPQIQILESLYQYELIYEAALAACQKGELPL